MDIKEVQSLIKFVAKSGVNRVKIKDSEFEITIEATPSSSKETIIQHMPSAFPVGSSAPAPAVAMPVDSDATSKEAPAKSTNYIEVKSPMIGTFYRKPSPDKETFVNVGDMISEGTIVCVVEAMKLFNEIESDISGKIVEVLVEDSSPVEYGQPLFLVDPKG